MMPIKSNKNQNQDQHKIRKKKKIIGFPIMHFIHFTNTHELN